MHKKLVIIPTYNEKENIEKNITEGFLSRRQLPYLDH